MKMRNKGKVHPSPTSSSSVTTSSPNRDAVSVLKLLPAAILALASVLSLEDREVLAYMITRSMKSPTPSSVIQEKKKNSKKSDTHKQPPLFNCECFDCYRSYWVRWDSSPNREVIHQAIEAFEEHLNNGEQSKKNRNRKREKISRRTGEKSASDVSGASVAEIKNGSPEIEEGLLDQELPGNGESPVIPSPETAEKTSEHGEKNVMEAQEDLHEEVAPPPQTAVAFCGTPGSSHKGLARKVLPDVLGLFNSRLWNLWSPNV